MSATNRFGKVYEKLASDYPSIAFSGYKNSPYDPDQMIVSTSEGEMVVRAVDDDGNYQMINFDVQKPAAYTFKYSGQDSVNVGKLPGVLDAIGYVGFFVMLFAGIILAGITINDNSGIYGVLWVLIGGAAGGIFMLPYLCIASIVRSLRSIDAKMSQLIK